MADTTTSSMFSESEMLGTSTQNEDIHSRHDETSSSEQDSTLEADSQGESPHQQHQTNISPRSGTTKLAQVRPENLLAQIRPTKPLAPKGPTNPLAPMGPTNSLAPTGPPKPLAHQGPPQQGQKKLNAQKRKAGNPETNNLCHKEALDPVTTKPRSTMSHSTQAEENPNRKKRKTTLQTTQPTKKSIDWKHR